MIAGRRLINYVGDHSTFELGNEVRAGRSIIRLFARAGIDHQIAVRRGHAGGVAVSIVCVQARDFTARKIDDLFVAQDRKISFNAISKLGLTRKIMGREVSRA